MDMIKIKGEINKMKAKIGEVSIEGSPEELLVFIKNYNKDATVIQRGNPAIGEVFEVAPKDQETKTDLKELESKGSYKSKINYSKRVDKMYETSKKEDKPMSVYLLYRKATGLNLCGTYAQDIRDMLKKDGRFSHFGGKKQLFYIKDNTLKGDTRNNFNKNVRRSRIDYKGRVDKMHEALLKCNKPVYITPLYQKATGTRLGGQYTAEFTKLLKADKRFEYIQKEGGIYPQFYIKSIPQKRNVRRKKYMQTSPWFKFRQKRLRELCAQGMRPGDAFKILGNEWTRIKNSARSFTNFTEEKKEEATRVSISRQLGIKEYELNIAIGKLKSYGVLSIDTLAVNTYEKIKKGISTTGVAKDIEQVYKLNRKLIVVNGMIVLE